MKDYVDRSLLLTQASSTIDQAERQELVKQALLDGITEGLDPAMSTLMIDHASFAAGALVNALDTRHELIVEVLQLRRRVAELEAERDSRSGG